MEEKKHTPVMVNELLNYFKPKKNSIFIDCILVSGGHLKFLLECHKKLKVIAFDDDEEAISRCQTLFSNSNSITFINDNFVNFPYHLETLNIKKVDGFFFDLGVSSEKLFDK